MIEPSIAKALAMKEGLSQVQLRKLQPVILEFDCQDLIKTLHGLSHPAWNICSIVEEILLTGRDLGLVEYSFTPCSSNFLAQNIAKWEACFNIYGILDRAVNMDYPTRPVCAKIEIRARPD
ncbi:hypothetical protein TorRG33x02_226910 [Trema orientale]|uniref:RNase H type-1 domain-containing protein n=1 Tax=Trema orientale TaxID=63057 RepID=A0A2P5E7H1_TREOI|nr:hypothetical protein TorRG33x02_226910 [Trema orientale]